MKEESILQNLGNNKGKQWYELYPERLAAEVELMRTAFPDFVLTHTSGENITWSGKVTCSLDDGTELYSLNIKIECPQNYPVVFPKVFDLDEVLDRKKCPHLNDDKKTLCYGNRLDSSLNFLGDTRVKNVVEYIAVFLGRQWYFERYGHWPDGQLHGANTFLDYELKSGRIEPTALCPCALNDKTYRDCHMKGVANLLLQMDNHLKPEIRNGIPKIGRNDPCPCGKLKDDGSPMKYKKCCEQNLNFPNSKTFLFFKFPQFIQGS